MLYFRAGTKTTDFLIDYLSLRHAFSQRLYIKYHPIILQARGG